MMDPSSAVSAEQYTPQGSVSPSLIPLIKARGTFTTSDDRETRRRMLQLLILAPLLYPSIFEFGYPSRVQSFFLFIDLDSYIFTFRQFLLPWRQDFPQWSHAGFGRFDLSFFLYCDEECP